MEQLLAGMRCRRDDACSFLVCHSWRMPIFSHFKTGYNCPMQLRFPVCAASIALLEMPGQSCERPFVARTPQLNPVRLRLGTTFLANAPTWVNTMILKALRRLTTPLPCLYQRRTSWQEPHVTSHAS